MSDPLDRFIDADARARIRAPIEEARTLPRQAFTSEEFQALEVERIFMRRWIAVCFQCEIPGAGDVLPFDLCGIPLVAVRGDDGRARVFHNICPYDGCPVAFEPANGLARLVVPYHGWIYDLSGKLVGTPFWDGHPKCEVASLGGRSGDLGEVPCESWLGVVWVSLAPEPEPFASHIAPVESVLAEYRIEEAAVGANADGTPIVERADEPTNWKTFLENACINVLHESFVHELYRRSPEVPRVTADGTPTCFHEVDGHLLTFGYRTEDFANTYDGLPIPHLGRDARPEHEHFLTLYPNLLISTGAEHMQVGFVLPLSPGHTEVSGIYLYEPTAAANPEGAPIRHALAAGYAQAADEDRAVMEAVQRARHSPAFEDQFYAPAWDALHHRWNQMILDDLERP